MKLAEVDVERYVGECQAKLAASPTNFRLHHFGGMKTKNLSRKNVNNCNIGAIAWRSPEMVRPPPREKFHARVWLNRIEWTCSEGPVLDRSQTGADNHADAAGRLCWKHSRHNTGRPCVGLNGTVVSFPHCEHTARVSVLEKP